MSTRPVTPGARRNRTPRKPWVALAAATVLAGCLHSGTSVRADARPPVPQQHTQPIPPKEKTPPEDTVAKPLAVQARGPAPGWASFEDMVAPQLSDLEGVFRQLNRPVRVGTLSSGVVVCRVSVTTQGFDELLAPDLRVTLRLGSDLLVPRRGPDNRSAMYLSVPAVRLRPGDGVSVEVADRDVLFDEPIDFALGRFDGAFPLELRSRHSWTGCVVMESQQVEQRVPRHVAAMDKRLAELERARPRLVHPQWGYPGQTVAQARDAVLALASLVGWEDGRVRERLARLDAFQARWDEAVKHSVRQVAERLPLAGGPERILGGRLTVRVLDSSCHRRAVSREQQLRPYFPGCEVEVELTQEKGAPLVIHPRQSWQSNLPTATLVLHDGQMHRMEPGRVRLGGYSPRPVTLSPGEKVTVVWQLKIDEGSSPPAMLWLSSNGHDSLLRLDAP